MNKEFQTYLPVLTLIIGYLLNAVGSTYSRNLKILRTKKKAFHDSLELIFATQNIRGTQKRILQDIEEWKSIALEIQKRKEKYKVDGRIENFEISGAEKLFPIYTSFPILEKKLMDDFKKISLSIECYKTSMHDLSDINPIKSASFIQALGVLFQSESFERDVQKNYKNIFNQIMKAISMSSKVHDQNDAEQITNLLLEFITETLMHLTSSC